MSTTPGPPSEEWIKSSYSNSNGGGCVEWAPSCAASAGRVPVRDSKTPDGPVLTFNSPAWKAFVADVRR